MIVNRQPLTVNRKSRFLAALEMTGKGVDMTRNSFEMNRTALETMRTELKMTGAVQNVGTVQNDGSRSKCRKPFDMTRSSFKMTGTVRYDKEW